MEIRVRQRSTTMKRTVNVLSKLNWATRACAVLVLCATTAIALPAQTLTTLFSFDGTHGQQPAGTLVQATNGDLYGTTYAGGANNGGGTVFKITPGGTLTTLYNFCSQTNCTDGATPYAWLVQAANGDLYGTTYAGGANNGGGTVFKITPGGTLTTLYSFCSQSGCTDGGSPYAGLVQDTNGDFYGTTADGGGSGTVFRLSVGLGPFVKTQPPNGKVGAAVEILGTNLTGATSLSFNGTAAVFTVVSPTLITTTVPAGASRARPGHQWGLLRDNGRWWRLRPRIPPVCRSGPVCENTASQRQSGSGRRDSRYQSDRRDQPQL